MFSTVHFIRVQSKTTFKEYQGRPYFSFVSGGISGVMSYFMVYPLVLLRTWLALDMYKPWYFNGTMPLVHEIKEIDGIKGFYKGMTIGIYGIFAYWGFYFGLYEALKTLFQPSSFLQSFLLA